jgi:spore germination protein GerM
VQSGRWWERALVVGLLIAIVLIAVWDYKRTDETWLGRVDYVTLYFSNEDATGLVAENRPIRSADDPIERTLEGLLAGPETPHFLRTIPPGVKVLGYRLEGTTLYVDFSEELRTNHWGGSTGEIMTVYSIVNSLTSVPGVELVVILLEGELQETLVGHLILDEPLARDESLIIKG